MAMDPITDAEIERTLNRETFAYAAKQIDEATGRLPAMANTPNMDRHREVILPSSFRASGRRFQRENPVILTGHQHKLISGEPSIIGLSHNLKVTPEGMPFEVAFVPAELYPAGTTPLGPLFQNFFTSKPPTMRAFSIGFIIEVEQRIESEEQLVELISELPPKLQALLIKGLKSKNFMDRVRYVIQRADLLEISAVAVPSNRESLALAAKGGCEYSRAMLRDLGDAVDDPRFQLTDRQFADRDEVLKAQPEAVREWAARELGAMVLDICEAGGDEAPEFCALEGADADGDPPAGLYNDLPVRGAGDGREGEFGDRDAGSIGEDERAADACACEGDSCVCDAGGACGHEAEEAEEADPVAEALSALDEIEAAEEPEAPAEPTLTVELTLAAFDAASFAELMAQESSREAVRAVLATVLEAGGEATKGDEDGEPATEPAAADDEPEEGAEGEEDDDAAEGSEGDQDADDQGAAGGDGEAAEEDPADDLPALEEDDQDDEGEGEAAEDRDPGDGDAGADEGGEDDAGEPQGDPAVEAAVPAFAPGGMVRNPGLFLVGEAGGQECIVPLPAGFVPVKLAGEGARSFETTIEIPIAELAPGAEIQDRAIKVDETPNQFRVRVRPPSAFQKDSFRQITLQAKKPRVLGVVGRLKGQTTTKLQSLRFPKEDKWTVAKVRAWVTAHPSVMKATKGADNDPTTHTWQGVRSVVELREAPARQIVEIVVRQPDVDANTAKVADALAAATKALTEAADRLETATARAAAAHTDTDGAAGSGAGTEPQTKQPRQSAGEDTPTDDYLTAELERAGDEAVAIASGERGKE